MSAIWNTTSTRLKRKGSPVTGVKSTTTYTGSIKEEEMKEQEKKAKRKPEATINHDPYLWKAIMEANNTEIKWKQEDIKYLCELFD